jgi:hypothetical protein
LISAISAVLGNSVLIGKLCHSCWTQSR